MSFSFASSDLGCLDLAVVEPKFWWCHIAFMFLNVSLHCFLPISFSQVVPVPPGLLFLQLVRGGAFASRGGSLSYLCRWYLYLRGSATLWAIGVGNFCCLQEPLMLWGMDWVGWQIGICRLQGQMGVVVGRSACRTLPDDQLVGLPRWEDSHLLLQAILQVILFPGLSEVLIIHRLAVLASNPET